VTYVAVRYVKLNFGFVPLTVLSLTVRSKQYLGKSVSTWRKVHLRIDYRNQLFNLCYAYKHCAFFEGHKTIYTYAFLRQSADSHHLA